MSFSEKDRFEIMKDALDIRNRAIKEDAQHSMHLTAIAVGGLALFAVVVTGLLVLFC